VSDRQFSIMAVGIPKPIRFLALATMALFVFLLFQIMRNPTVAKLPEGHAKLEDMVRDPNLDGRRKLQQRG
ncbi:UNVERIFIED_CONTAM: hypothetical protein NY603_42055, partial [Bacteroidetes bacterium 56_B9]